MVNEHFQPAAEDIERESLQATRAVVADPGSLREILGRLQASLVDSFQDSLDDGSVLAIPPLPSGGEPSYSTRET
jgi:hypothetical protein